MAKWQTRNLEEVVPSRACGFDSHCEHSGIALAEQLSR